MVLNIHRAYPTPMPYNIVGSLGFHGKDFRDLRTARAYLKRMEEYGLYEPVHIEHKDRYGKRTVVE